MEVGVVRGYNNNMVGEGEDKIVVNHRRKKDREVIKGGRERQR